jgi:hypothetical protein
MKRECLCKECSEIMDGLLVRYRTLTLTRIGEKKIVLRIVSDQDPGSFRLIEDGDVTSCIERIPK